MIPELRRQFILCREFCRHLGVPEFASSEYEADDLIGTLAARVRSDLAVDLVGRSGIGNKCQHPLTNAITARKSTSVDFSVCGEERTPCS